MELLQLQYFAESAETENFSKTAAKYLVPPSTVSASIKKLETELGCDLFDRGANTVHLNANGRAFFKMVHAALALLEEGKNELLPPTAQKTETIRLLIRSERSFINDRMVQFKRQYPHVNFRLTHTFSPHDLTDYDIIIDGPSGEYRGCSQTPLLRESIKIAAAAANPLCGKPLTLHDLAEVPFITMSSGSSLHQITKEVCHTAGFTPRIIIESDDPLYIRRYIKDDFGIAFYPEISWENTADSGIAFLNVTDLQYSRTTYAYLNHKAQPSTAVRRFFDYIGNR